MNNYILEACIDSVESAINAVSGGANRLELCSNLVIGGTTPSPWLFKEIRKNCDVKIHVLIRPRFGDFYYSDYEFNIIKEEVQMFKDLGAEGVVIGILNKDGTLDTQRMKELVEIAKGMSITLHRAFDVCVDPYIALEESKALGIHTILTSGQKDNCVAGKDLLKELIQRSEGKIDILVAGGVGAAVIEELQPYTAASSYHMSGKIVKDSGMEYRKEGVNMGLSSMSEYEIWETKKENIEAARDVLWKLVKKDSNINLR